MQASQTKPLTNSSLAPSTETISKAARQHPKLHVSVLKFRITALPVRVQVEAYSVFVAVVADADASDRLRQEARRFPCEGSPAEQAFPKRFVCSSLRSRRLPAFLRSNSSPLISRHLLQEKLRDHTRFQD
jgi:hypothetical protein